MADTLLPSALLDRAARRFKLLGEPVRLELLNWLHVHGETSVQELAAGTGHSQANVSKHLLLMAREGMLSRQKDGLHVLYAIQDPTLTNLCGVVCGQIQQELRELSDLGGEG